MKHAPTLARWPLLTLALAGVALAAAAWPGTAAAALEFSRAGLAAGEGWRLFTGHLVHFGASHLAWDVGVFLALGTLAERTFGRGRLALLLAAGALLVSGAVWAWQPQFEIYRGLSALDSALFGALLASRAREGWAAHDSLTLALTGIALMAFAGKCLAEAASGAALFAAGPFTPVPLAHLVGLAAGIGAALLPSATARRLSSAPHRDAAAPVFSP